MLHKNWPNLSLSAVTLLLAGCAAVPYKAPTSGATATVIVRHTTSSGASYLNTYGDLKSCGGLQQVIGATQKIPEDFSIAVKAGEPVGFQYNNSLGTAHCSISSQFSPVPNGKYVLTLRSDATSCAMGVYTVNNGNLVPEPSRMRLVPNGMGQGCSATPFASGGSTDSKNINNSAGPKTTTLDDLKGLR